ncbi:MAG TPA: 7-cyano-7-deazaguanine synthase, partial [Methanocorpusculum sp.]|nr:7-cyano-7-deazaguanine synthase [Methanocorpusculum sp.]
MKKAVCLLSGGMDSTTLAYVAREMGYEILALHMNYGQRTEKKERECAVRIAEHLDAADFVEIGENDYVVYGDDIYATEFDTVFTATVVVNGEDTANVKYSVNSYIYAICNKANVSDSMLELAKAT